jgi:hypothetical protein
MPESESIFQISGVRTLGLVIYFSKKIKPANFIGLSDLRVEQDRNHLAGEFAV